MTESVAVQPDMERLQTFVGKVMGDIGGALALLLSYIGDQSGVFRALRDHGPCSSAQLAQAAGVDERYLREWLSAMAAGGYVVYQPADDSFALTPEQAIVLAAEGHPACMQGFFQAVVSQFATHEQALDVFRSGAGRPWSSHHGCFFCGTDRFFRAGYAANLVDAWLPLTFALNSLNRSMGQPDLYPFVLAPPVIEKLGFVHALRMMQQSGYCGAYLTVIESGQVRAGDLVELLPGPREVNLRELFMARRHAR